MLKFQIDMNENTPTHKEIRIKLRAVIYMNSLLDLLSVEKISSLSLLYHNSSNLTHVLVRCRSKYLAAAAAAASSHVTEPLVSNQQEAFHEKQLRVTQSSGLH